jgi:glucosylceramidase
LLYLFAIFAVVPATVAAQASDIVIYASDVSKIVGKWTHGSDATAAGGEYLYTPDAGWATPNVPLANPADYFEVTFSAPANTAYRAWFRLRGTANSKYNESIWVQYSDALRNGSPAYSIGSTSGILVNLENCSGCGIAGWGWQGGAYWLSQPTTIQFASTGTHTMRVQVREDGAHVDQIVLSPATYLSSRPGALKNDTTIVPKSTTPPPATSTPYLGTPAAIPGILKTENFDDGGRGVAYVDTTTGNSGNAYRSTDVDIQPATGGGYNIGWVEVGEWLNYTANVASSGTYTLSFRVACPGQGGTFHLESNGTNLTGPVTVPNTGGWQVWRTVAATASLTAGRQILRLVMDSRGSGGVGNFGRIEFTTGTTPPPTETPGPYTGTPAAIPGEIPSVHFDKGGANVAYFDTTTGNSGGAFRATDVDIEASAGGGYNVGWTAANEWLKYTVNVATSGPSIVQMRVASAAGGGSLHVGFNGSATVWSPVSVPSTGGWQTWTTVSVPVTLGAGVQQMTIQFDTAGVNLGPITVSLSDPTGTPATANVWVTSRDGSKKLAPQPTVAFVAGTGSSSLPTIDVVDNVRYQQIEGFGGSITDSSAWILSGLTSEKRSSILTALFDRTSGLGLSFLRQPIGSSDFSLNMYTFNDIDPATTDYPLANFSIDHDRQYILPVLRAARAKNPAIRIMGSPWSAPAWMKTNRTLIDGGRLRPEAYATYANYFVKFVQEYTAEGVPIDSLTVQNEPMTAPHYPSMLMSSSEQATFIGQHLGPALARAGLNTRIFAWDHNWETTYPLAVLSNTTARSYISGVAFHCYGGAPSEMSGVRNAYPTLAIALTECGDGSRATFGSKLSYDIRVLLIGSLRNWARTVGKWNLVLDQNGGPKLVQEVCRNCRGYVTVDTSSGAITYNEEYYAIGHVSRFVRPGAYRIDSTEFGFGGIENVAFMNPDGSIVVLAFNSAWGTRTFQIRSRGATLQYTLPSESVATFKWTPQ